MSALESRSDGLSPTALLARAWRHLMELRVDDALEAIARFEVEIARIDGSLAPRSAEIAEVLRAVLQVLKRRDGAARLAEPLSPREQCILRSMSRGLSNKRIALELQIAPETVKSHIKRIFIKLEVQSRAHAVSTASALGML